jgi:hypothetical protein
MVAKMRFGPDEGLGIDVDGLDVARDRRFEFGGRAMDAAADLFFHQIGQDALDLVDPGGRGWGLMHVPARPPREPVADRLGLMAGYVVHDDMDIVVRGDIGLGTGCRGRSACSNRCGMPREMFAEILSLIARLRGTGRARMTSAGPSTLVIRGRGYALEQANWARCSVGVPQPEASTALCPWRWRFAIAEADEKRVADRKTAGIRRMPSKLRS